MHKKLREYLGEGEVEPWRLCRCLLDDVDWCDAAAASAGVAKAARRDMHYCRGRLDPQILSHDEGPAAA